MGTRRETIEARLRTALAPVHLEVHDDSGAHAGHAGAAGGGSHFSCRVVAESFRGCSLVDRHRAVYAALGDLFARDIHALAIEAYDPDEWARREPD